MIFLDSGAFIARFRASDAYHPIAMLGWRNLEKTGRKCFTNSLVIAEAAKFVGHHQGNLAAAAFVRSTLGSDFTIIRNTAEHDEEAVDLLIKYADQKIGFADCVSFVQMRQNRIRHVFGFDRHFEIAGFTLWPTRN